jgi:hypothetical protein
MASIFDWLFDPTETKSSTSTQLPKWVEQAGKTNYQLASGIAQRPYQTYDYPRIAPFSDDQTTAMSTLRSSQPRALKFGETPYRPPRLIDNIPGETAGGIKEYMNPFVDEVVNRGVGRMREAADVGRQRIANQAHMTESFGDARHAIDDSLLEREFQKEVGDFSARQYSDAFTAAQAMREGDIERDMRAQGIEQQDFMDLLRYIDSLYKSGDIQEDKTQASLDLAHSDFQKQFNYPTEMLDLLTAALTGTPYNKTTTSTEPGPSNAASILSTVGSILGAFL